MDGIDRVIDSIVGVLFTFVRYAIHPEIGDRHTVGQPYRGTAQSAKGKGDSTGNK